MVKELRTRIPLIALCGVFIGLGMLLIPYAGIHNDEALFAIPIYQNRFEFRIPLFGHDIPLMVMSYIGTVKTALYWALFKAWPPGLYSVRLPTVLLGAVTIYFFFRIASAVSHGAAAWMAAILLATDPTFLLTNTFDWGPVAVEHFLVVTGCLLLVRFASQAGYLTGQAPRVLTGALRGSASLNSILNILGQGGRRITWSLPPGSGLEGHWYLVTGFFLLGVALWNKAIFLASLAGLAVAAAVVCWTQIRALVTWNRVRLAVLAFLLGSAPLLLYNARRRGATLGTNANLEVPNLSVTLRQLRGSMDGSVLFGYLTSADRTHPRPVASAAGRAGEWLQAHVGESRRGGLLAACLLSLLLIPVWWRSPAARFSLVFCAVHWSLVIMMREGGTGPHHVVLMWPFPHLFVAATLSRLPWRRLGLAAAAVIAAANLFVISQYFLEFERNGPGLSYSDAMILLSSRMPEYSNRRIYVTDWGIQNSLALLHEGKLRLEIAELAFRNDKPSDAEQELRDRIFADRDAILLGHVEGSDLFPGVHARLEQQTRGRAFRKQILETLEDTHGRPVFEIFRLLPQQ